MLHAVSSNRLAGTERHVLALAEALRDLGCDARILCRRDAQVVAGAARERGVPVAGPQWLWNREAAVIHAHDGRSALASVGLGRRGGTAIVRTQHFVAPASALRRGVAGAISLRAHRLINSRCQGQIMVSESVLASARARQDLGSGPVAVIPSGIQLPSPETVSRAAGWRQTHPDPVLVTAGRLEPERHLEVLLEAMSGVLERFPDCRLIVAGDGSAVADLQALAQRRGIDHALEWTGWLPELGRVLERAHIYVNTWPLEAFGMATAEAMSYGLAPVVPDAGAARELIEPGRSGVAFRADDAGALAEVLCRLLDDRDRVAELGAQARQRAGDYAMPGIAARILDFYGATAAPQRTYQR